MRLVVIFVSCVLNAPCSATTTEEFMNVMTACGVGSKVSVSSTMKERAQLIWQEGAAQGEAAQDIALEIGKLIFDDTSGEIYRVYVECVTSMLRDGRGEPEIPKFVGSIGMTYPYNSAFLAFLESNDGKVIYIDSTIIGDLAEKVTENVVDACLQTPWANDPSVPEGDDFFMGVVKGRHIGIPTLIDNLMLENAARADFEGRGSVDSSEMNKFFSAGADDIDCGWSIQLNILQPSLRLTHTGSHTFRLKLRGFFEVMSLYEDGYGDVYALDELEASGDLRVRMN